MTCTDVNQLIDELQRFKGARLEQEVEVDGVSPSTQCTVIGSTHEDVEGIKEEARNLDDRNDELLDICKEIRELLKDDDSILSLSVVELLDKAEA